MLLASPADARRAPRPPRARRAAAIACSLLLLLASAAVAAPRQDDKLKRAAQVFEEANQLLAGKTKESCEQAAEKFREALGLAREAASSRVERVILDHLGKTYLSLGQFDRARQTYEQAIQISPAPADRGAEADLYYNLAFAYRELGGYQEAAERLDRALGIYRDLKQPLAVAEALVYQGEVFDYLSRDAESIRNYGEALEIFRREGKREHEAVALSSLGNAYVGLGRYRKAVEHYDSALDIYRDPKVRGGKAPAAHGCGVPDRYAEVRANEVSTLISLGFAFHNLRDYKLAVSKYDDALKAQAEVTGGLTGQREKILMHKGSALAALGRLDEAQALGAQALDAHRREGRLLWEARTLFLLGRVASARGRHDEAAQHLDRALALMRELGARRREGDVLGELMLVARAMNRPRLAVFYGKQAVNAYQEMRAGIGGLDRETQDAFVGSKEDTYRALADLLISLGRFPEAQQVLGMLKQEEYSDFTRRSGGGEAPAPVELTDGEKKAARPFKEIAGRVAALGLRERKLADKRPRTPEDDAELARLRQDIKTARAQFETVLKTLREELKGADPEGLRVHQIREAEAIQGTLGNIGAGAVALYTVAGPEKYRVLMFTAKATVAGEREIKRADLYAKIFKFRDTLRNPHLDPLPLAKELYDILVRPIEGELKGIEGELKGADAMTLMWSLDGPLRYIPFGALHDGEKYMVERFRNVIFTQASLLNLDKEPAAGPRKVLGFGVSKPWPDFPALGAVPDELRAVTAAGAADGAAASTPANGGAPPRSIYLDADFNAVSFEGALQERYYPVVHIASHFHFRPGRDYDSFLLLGDGKPLSLAQLNELPLLFSGVELLTLSACDTASSSGPADNGSEVDSFGEIAQRKGAKAVVASLWPVADKSTLELMQHFYRSARPGVPKAEALKLAQVALLKGAVATPDCDGSNRGTRIAAPPAGGPPSGAAFKRDPKAPCAHPYFWAPFIMIGNWR